MSVTLATIADALIEFILSLLQDPEAAAEFEADPEGTLEAKGLAAVRPADVCAVAPVIAERPDVVSSAVAGRVAPTPTPTHDSHNSEVVNEIRNVVNNMSYVDDRDTLIDQSVNQNIWAGGDVTQTFDQEAVVASGDDAIAAGHDVDIDHTLDESTNFTAGEDVNVGNDTDTTVVDDSGNETIDTTTTTDSSTDATATDSLNDTSTDVAVDDSFNSATEYTNTTDVDVQADVAYDSTETTIVDETAPSDEF